MTSTRGADERAERHRVEELLLDEITDQLDRTRRLLMGNPEAAAEAALNRVSLAVLKVHVEHCVPAAAAQGPDQGRGRAAGLYRGQD